MKESVTKIFGEIGENPCIFTDTMTAAVDRPVSVVGAPPPQQTTTLAADAAGILERDYGIDAGEVLSMNVDTVETSGLVSSSPNFAEVVNDAANWEPYAQKTYKACFSDGDGYLLTQINPSIEEGSQGRYEEVTSLPAEGESTTVDYFLTKMIRYNNEAGHSNGSFKEYDVKAVIPAGSATTEDLVGKTVKDPNGKDQHVPGKYGLTGAVYSYVKGGPASADGNRGDYGGWWGTALLNNNEYEADNIDASFRLIKGGNLNEGFCFFVNKSDVEDTVYGQKVPRLTGYFISVCCHNYNAVRTLWRIDNYALDTDFRSNETNGMWCCPGNRELDWIWYAGAGDKTHKYIPRDIDKNVTISQQSTQMTPLATWIDDAQNIDYKIKADGRSIVIKRTDNGEETDGNAVNSVNNATKWGYENLQTTKVDNAINFPNKRNVEETVANITITENESGTSTTYSDSVSNATTTIERPNITKGTYGLWGQNCEQGNQALITNLNVGITKTKSFGDIVYEPNWTDGALHMLINIDTKADKTMLGSDE